MTALDDRMSVRDTIDETASALAVEAVDVVCAAGYASQRLIVRKLRVGWDQAAEVLAALVVTGVVASAPSGSDHPVLIQDPDRARQVLVDHESPVTLPSSLPAEPASQPSRVDLTKHQLVNQSTGPDQPWHDDWDIDQPGTDLVLRPDYELAIPDRPAMMRARQATARAWILVVDQPAVTRTLAVTKQSPTVAKKLIRRTPRGGKRAIILLRDWVIDAQGATLLAKHAEAGEGEAWTKVDTVRSSRVAARRVQALALTMLIVLPVLAWVAPIAFAAVLAVGLAVAVWSMVPRRDPRDAAWTLLAAAVVGAVIWFWLGPLLASLVAGWLDAVPLWVWSAVAVGLVGWLSWLGRIEGEPPVEMPMDQLDEAHEPTRPTADMVVDALCRLGITSLTPAVIDQVREETRVIAPGVGRSKRGWHLQMELPWAVTAGQVMEKREQLAAALKRELGTVWPSQGPRHPGHLALFLADRPMATAPQDPWFLTGGGRVDIFERQEMFTDQEGGWVELVLAWKRILIGGASGTGKSFYTRQIGILAAFDPRVRIYCFDGKVNGDLDPIMPVAHGFFAGNEPEETAEQLAALREVEKEMLRRNRFLRSLPREENPQNKITSALVDHYLDQLAPIVLLLDEIQEYTEHEEKEIRDEFKRILTRFARLGRSAGIIPVFCTQKPDSSVIPTSISSNCSTRFCLKVNDSGHVDQVLGTSSHKNGLKANLFSSSDVGLAWHKGDGQDPLVVRSVHGLDAVVAEELIEQARSLRARLGMLTGQAAGDLGIVDAEIVIDIVADTEQILRARDRDRAQHAEVVDWLRALRPENYGALDVEELSARLRAQDVPIRQVRIDGANRKGIRMADLRKQLELDDEAE